MTDANGATTKDHVAGQPQRPSQAQADDGESLGRRYPHSTQTRMWMTTTPSLPE